MDAFIGEVIMISGRFAPVGWSPCNGQSLKIKDNAALYSVIGTTYGGDGKDYFNLPNLNGRVAIQQGKSAEGITYGLGQTGGSAEVTLTEDQVPAHTHQLMAAIEDATTGNPSGAMIANGVDSSTGDSLPPCFIKPSLSSILAPMHDKSISVVGKSQPHNNMQPYIVITYAICLSGQYPY